MSLSAGELSILLEARISNYYSQLDVNEIGRVISFADGIARREEIFKIESEISRIDMPWC